MIGRLPARLATMRFNRSVTGLTKHSDRLLVGIATITCQDPTG
jgi:hypothetical protein